MARRDIRPNVSRETLRPTEEISFLVEAKILAKRVWNDIKSEIKRHNDEAYDYEIELLEERIMLRKESCMVD